MSFTDSFGNKLTEEEVEDQLRRNRYAKEEVENIIAKLLREKDEEIAEQERQIAEKDRQIAEADRQIAELDKKIDEVDKKIYENKNLITELKKQ